MIRLFIISIILFFSLNLNGQSKDSVRARAFADLAWKAYQQNYFKKCIRLLDSAISFDRTNSDNYRLKAEAQWFLGQYAQAAETYKIRISLGGDNLLKVGAYVFLGMLYGKAGMPEQAIDQYSSAIKLWENGYIPHKLFIEFEESEYFLALAFLGDKAKATKLLSEESIIGLPFHKQQELKSRSRIYLTWFDKTPNELLEEQFSKYMLPDHILPLEE